MPETAESTAAESSRESTRGAGWHCTGGRYQQLMAADPRRPGKQRRFSWLNPRPLLASRNDRLARMLGDPTNKLRKEWLERLPENRDRIVRVDGRADGSVSFLLTGDTGEGDGSQFALIPPLEQHAEDSAFLFICSDVIYPAGGIDDYLYSFFKPYRAYDRPIFAIPGNHDWYDNGAGFMYWFCGGESAPKPGGLLRKLLWRRPPPSTDSVIRSCRELRGGQGQQARQPGPYFAIDAGPLRLVGIDTGITGQLDEDQGRWLKRISQGSRPKILLTGKPIYVDGERRPGKIAGTEETVDDIVTTWEHNYIAAIGGDIHNYQRYPVGLAGERTLLYLVAGGGGAFMHETHTIPNMDRQPINVSEDDFRCYPLRGDSLSRYSQLYAKKWLGRRAGASFIPSDQASALLGEQFGVTPTRSSARQVEITPETRKTAKRLDKLPKRGRRGLHIPFSEWLDTDDPPLFKSFLRVDASADSVRIRCFGVSGCQQHQSEPPVEDDLRAQQSGGRWAWTLPPR